MMNRKMDAKSIRIWILVSVAAMAAIAFFAFMAGWAAEPGPCYDSVKKENGYQAELTSWTGTDDHSIHMEAGDRLHVVWSLQAGVIDVTIAMPDRKAVYTASRVSAKDNPDASFDVVIPESGDYLICISAGKATGRIEMAKS